MEQLLHRNVALDPNLAFPPRAWRQRSPLIIDKSDDHLAVLPRALQWGYLGTSHKNGKGAIKGVAHLAD